MDRSLQLVQYTAERRMAAHRSQLGMSPASHALERVVTPFATHHGPQDDRLVHDLGYLGKTLPDLDTRNIGGDRLEWATNFLWRFGLDLPHVLMGRTTAEEDVDDRLVVCLRTTGRIDAIQVRQVQAASAHAQRPDLQESAPGYSVTVSATVVPRPKNGQHAVYPCNIALQRRKRCLPPFWQTATSCGLSGSPKRRQTSFSFLPVNVSSTTSNGNLNRCGVMGSG